MFFPKKNAGVCGQMSLSVGPDALWLANDGAHGVVLGSVIQVFCAASGVGSGDVMWTRDGFLLRSDPPHIRIRVTSGDGGAVVSTLTVDNFRSTDGGSYVCKTNSSRSSELQLTGQSSLRTSCVHVYITLLTSCIHIL